MSSRRMLKTDFFDRDEFIELDATSQNLYIRIVLNADDDGICSGVKSIMRIIGAKQKHLEELIVAEFIQVNEKNHAFINDWGLHQNIQPSKYTPTEYLDEYYQFIQNDRVIAMLDDGGKKEEIRQNLLAKRKKSTTVSAEKCRRSDADTAEKCRPSIVQESIIQDSIIQSSIIQSSSNSNIADTTTTTSASPPKDYTEIIDYWNETLKFDVPTVKALNSKREENLNKLLNDFTIEEIKTAIDNISESKLLLGREKNHYKTNFDWFIQPDNFIKVLEGNYNKSEQPRYKSSQEMIDDIFG